MLVLGVVGHEEEIKNILELLQYMDNKIETTAIHFNDFNNKDTLIRDVKKHEKKLDALLFTDKISFELVNSAMISSIPWVYIKKNENLLLTTLLNLSIIKNKDITALSIDTYDQKTIDKIFNRIGLNHREQVAVADYDIFNQNFIHYLVNFHEEQYHSNVNTTCITSLIQVYNKLRKKNIPCVHLKATNQRIKDAINHLALKIQSKKDDKSQTVVIAIKIDPINEYSLINENEYQILLEKTKVTQKIYLFAQKIQASVVEVGIDQYFLFCTKSILETETNDFKKLDILTDVSNDTSSTISMGIGYGITVREAKFNAQEGMKNSQNAKGNRAYIVYNNETIGPIASEYQSIEKDQGKHLDEQYNKIAKDVTVSINTIFKLHCIIDETQKNTFTSKELSGHLDITPRSVNRILNKLEEKGYAEVIGKKMISNAGRPSRIIKLNF
jgi:hypothetical protein